MNIVDRRVDNERNKVPVRATCIRENIEENKKWLEDIVYEDYKKQKSEEKKI